MKCTRMWRSSARRPGGSKRSGRNAHTIPLLPRQTENISSLVLSFLSVSNFIVEFPTLLCSFQLYCSCTSILEIRVYTSHRHALGQVAQLVHVAAESSTKTWHRVIISSHKLTESPPTFAGKWPMMSCASTLGQGRVNENYAVQKISLCRKRDCGFEAREAAIIYWNCLPVYDRSHRIFFPNNVPATNCPISLSGFN